MDRDRIRRGQDFMDRTRASNSFGYLCFPPLNNKKINEVR
jgi:hypothetical protein